jgi:hypothetical protein
VHHANTEPQPGQPHDVEQAMTLDAPPLTIPNPLQPFDEPPPGAKKKGFIARKIFRLRHRRHHPATAQAYEKSIWGNLKAILFSSWVNVMLVFVPVVHLLWQV